MFYKKAVLKNFAISRNNKNNREAPVLESLFNVVYWNNFSREEIFAILRKIGTIR